MIVLEPAIVSDDIKEKYFICDLDKCKGACCVEGDAGAPLELEEVAILEEIYDKVKPYLPQLNQKTIDEKGLFEVDSEGDFCTTTINNKECVFAYYETNGKLSCGIEKAYLDKKINFQKPISCHLYPIRVSKVADKFLLNYHRWDICTPACELGAKHQVPLYKFLKEPLERMFGQKWYQDFCNQVEKD
jgi:hypothetical protein